MSKIRPAPCAFCPYRRDVPSGIWHESEYRKLPAYDLPTGEQPFDVFGCHERTGLICAGWAQCHGWKLMALRLAASDSPIDIPKVTHPLFSTGAEAAKHGLQCIGNPSLEARRAMQHIECRRRNKTK